jgi:hypothetical protein
LTRIRYFTLVQKFAAFARANKVWWLVPMVLIVLGAGIMIVLGDSPTPFIYNLF